MKRLTIAVALALAACQSTTPEQKTAAARPVTCTPGADCDARWGRALRWVLDNSRYRIQTQSDTVIATMGPMQNDTSPAFVITKQRALNGFYVIDFHAACDTVFGCTPTVIESKASFVTFVMGP
jgi:hypothetical protein